MSLTIISGGQAGVDRGALDVALALGLPCGGFCPLNRLAEDGPIPERYPLTESLSPHYIVRTVQNLLTTDATVIFHEGALTGGTLQTARYCELHGKPLLQCDAAAMPSAAAVAALRAFIDLQRVERLNVAGPRLSQSAAAATFTTEVLTLAFRVNTY